MSIEQSNKMKFAFDGYSTLTFFLWWWMVAWINISTKKEMNFCPCVWKKYDITLTLCATKMYIFLQFLPSIVKFNFKNIKTLFPKVLCDWSTVEHWRFWSKIVSRSKKMLNKLFLTIAHTLQLKNNDVIPALMRMMSPHIGTITLA